MPDTLPASRRVQIGHVVCDFHQLTLDVEGEVIRLEPRLAGLLAVLVQRPGEVISRDELLSLAWDAGASDEALTQAVSRLRKLLGDRTTIETIPRVGYRLTASLADAPAAAASTPVALTAWGAPGGLLSPVRRRGLRGAGLLVLAATLGALLALWLLGQDRMIEQEFEIQPAERGEIEFIPNDEPDAGRD